MSSHLLYVCELTFRSEIELKTQPPSSSERHAKRFQRKIKMPPAISIVTFGASASGVHLKPSILSLITTPPMLVLAFAWTGPCSRHLRPKSNQREPASSSITKSISLSSVHPAALWHSATDRQTTACSGWLIGVCERAAKGIFIWPQSRISLQRQRLVSASSSSTPVVSRTAPIALPSFSLRRLVLANARPSNVTSFEWCAEHSLSPRRLGEVACASCNRTENRFLQNNYCTILVPFLPFLLTLCSTQLIHELSCGATLRVSCKLAFCNCHAGLPCQFVARGQTA